MLKLVFWWCACSSSVHTATEGVCFASPAWTQKFKSAQQRTWEQGQRLAVATVTSPQSESLIACMNLHSTGKAGDKQAFQVGWVFRIISFSGNYFPQDHKFIMACQHGNFFSFALASFINGVSIVKSTINCFEDKDGKINLSLAASCIPFSKRFRE